LLCRSPLLPAAPNLIGFGHPQMAKGAPRIAIERPLVPAITGAGFLVAILGPEAGFVAVVQDAVEEFAAGLAGAHRRSDKMLSGWP
jgi:hypothetical protein